MILFFCCINPVVSDKMASSGSVSLMGVSEPEIKRRLGEHMFLDGKRTPTDKVGGM